MSADLVVRPFADGDEVAVEVRATNRDVLDFYERLGFKLDDVASFEERLDGP